MSPAKTAEPIEMPLGLRTGVGPGKHVLDGGPDPPMGRGNFERVVYAKMAEPIEMPFGFTIRVGAGNHVSDTMCPNTPVGRGNFWGKKGQL